MLTIQTTETETEEDKTLKGLRTFSANKKEEETLSDNKTTKERRRKTEIIEREAQLEIKEELIEEIATLRLFKERANDDNNNIKNKNMQEQKYLEEKLSKAHEKRIEEMMSERENLLNELNDARRKREEIERASLSMKAKEEEEKKSLRNRTEALERENERCKKEIEDWKEEAKTLKEKKEKRDRDDDCLLYTSDAADK